MMTLLKFRNIRDSLQNPLNPLFSVYFRQPPCLSKTIKRPSQLFVACVKAEKIDKETSLILQNENLFRR